VDGYQAEGTWAAAHFAPVVLVRLRGAQMAILRAVRRELEALLRSVHLAPRGQAAKSPSASHFASLDDRVPALRASAYVWIRARRVLVDGRRRLHAARLGLASRRTRHWSEVAISAAPHLGRCG
jgi:hypothetical protein